MRVARFSFICERALLNGRTTLFQGNSPLCKSANYSPFSSLDNDPERVDDPSYARDGSTIRNFEVPKRSYAKNYGMRTATTTATTAEAEKAEVPPEPPKPRGLPIVGTLFSLLACGGAKKLHEYVDRRHKELGPVYREKIGPVQAIFVNSPYEFRRIFRLEGTTPKHFVPEAWTLYNEIRKCKRGLLFMDEEEWLHFRRILNKLMLVPDPTVLMAGPCQEAAEALAEKWKVQVGTSGTITELESHLYKWSIETMMATLMGSSWQGYKERLSHDCDNLARMLHKVFEYSASLSMVPAKLAMTLNLSSWSGFVGSVDTALGIVRKLVPEMARLGGDGLLKMMMDEGIQDDDLVRVVADFIIAAGDTTAFSMQWALLLLGSHPNLQSDVLERVKGLSQEDLLRVPLLKGIIKETLRLYPVAPFITRYLPENSVIGGYLVRKEELLLLSIYSSSRDARNFPQADEFHPERWLRTEEGNYKNVIHPHASVPFAMGARSCIGRKLAETQMILTLVQLMKNFKIECINRNQIKLILHLISVPSESIQLKLSQRKL